MSNVIDEKVVQMQFDNKNFEKNIKTSLSTLEELDESLRFEGANKGFRAINDAAKKINLGNIGEGIETIKAKFSALEVIAVTALANIANSAVNTGKRLISSLTIDQVTSGWTKYSDKTSAVQTIMAATASQFDDTATQMDYVNKQLEKLNWFTDETSYNFLDMTSNIGKFTSQNIDLDTSVTAMQGIANWAAISGSNAMEASRAMYNLSQSLGTGSVRLIDWKSIELANMATVEFKQTAIDSAVELGTLKKVGDGLYQTLEGSDVSIANFNDGLKDAWFTSEVLLKSLNKYGGFADILYEVSQLTGLTATDILQAVDKYEQGSLDLNKMAVETGLSVAELTPLMDKLSDSTYDLGKRSFKTAQEAKTFKEAVDATKDAVSTGWMNTFELMFGDYEDARKLWTNVAGGLYDIFAASAEARNDMLRGWVDLGGRDSMLKGFKNAFEGLSSIVTPVKEAFREIFAPLTSEKLYNFTKGFELLTERLKISETTAENIKRTFKGFFAILDIGFQAIKAIGGAFLDFIEFISPLGGGILKASANLGDFFVNLDKTIKETDFFRSSIEKLKEAFFNVKGYVSNFIDQNKTLKTIIETLSDVFESAKDRVKNFIESIKESFGGFSSIDTSGLDDFTDHVNTKFEPFKKIGEIFEKIFETFKSIVKKMTPVFATISGIMADVFGGLGGAVADGIQNFDLQKLLDLLNSGLFAGILIGVTNFVKDFGSVVEDVGSVANSISGILEGVKGSIEAFQQSIKAKTLLTIASAMAILTASLISLSRIDPEKLDTALTTMTMMFVELFGSMAAMNKIIGGEDFLGMTKAASAMVVMSTAVLILAGALTKISKIDPETLTGSIIAITVLISELVATAKILSTSSGKMMKGSTGLIAFSVAINILSSAVKKMGELDVETLVKGLASMGAVLTELSLFLSLTNFKKFGSMKSLGLIGLAASMKIFASAVSQFGEMDVKSIVKGLGAMGVVMTELGLFLSLASFKKIGAEKSLELIGLAASMKIFASVINDLGQLSVKELAKGLSAMAAALIEVVIAANLMPPNMALKSAGLIGVAVALKILSSAVSGMGKMSWKEIGKGLVTLAGSLTIMAVALVGMGKAKKGAASLITMSLSLAILTPVLKSLGKMSWESIGKGLLTLVGVFTVLGVSAALLQPLTPTILALSGAIALLGVGIGAISAGVFLFSAALTTLSVSATSVAAGLTLIISSIVGLIPIIGEKLAEAVVAFAKVISEGAPAVGEALKNLILALCDVINGAAPTVIDTLMKLLVKISEALLEYAPILLENGINLIIALVDGISSKIGDIVNAAVELISAFLLAIGEQVPKVVDAAFKMIIAFINGLADAISENSPSLVDAVEKLILALLGAAVDILTGGIDIIKEIGKKIINSGLVQGISENIQNFVSKMAEIIPKGVTAIKEKLSDIKSVGGEIISNFVDGFKDKVESAIEAVKDFAKSIVDGIKDIFGINSPSKVFEEIGIFVGEGFINGIEDMINRIKEEAELMANTFADYMTIEKITPEIDADYIKDLKRPHISAVLDMDSDSYKNFRDQYMEGLKANNDIATNTASSITNSYATTIDDSKIVGAINRLNERINAMSKAMTGQKVVLDSGTLVGEIAPKMDMQLGSMAKMKGRGN